MTIEENTRVKQLGIYLENILKELNEDYRRINANFLGLEVNNYSLDKIPTASIVEPYITGGSLNRDVFSFRSRNSYSQDRINNLNNIGFFEKFESVIYSNNTNGILPEIEGIESIKCLDCGTTNNATNNTCEMDIQIQIEYEMED